MERSPVFLFNPLETPVKCLAARERHDQIVQYNLDKNLQIVKFRFTGSLPKTSSDYDQLIVDFLTSPITMKGIELSGSPTLPLQYDARPLKFTVMNMGFFDKLEESTIIGPGGTIKGCFDETFDGITVGDSLREMLLNEVSENADLFSAEDKSELIFQLFRIITVGGALCQPDSELQKYLDITKDLYKELVTIYKDSKTDTVQFSGRAYSIQSVENMDLYSGGAGGGSGGSDSPHSRLLLIIDPIKKTVTAVKNTFKSFW